MDISRLSIRDLENEIAKYIKDAAALAEGRPFRALYCYISGIQTPAQLSEEIKRYGAAYIEKMKTLRDAAPVVRGDTISIYEPKPDPTANAPSREDENFMALCRKQLLSQGFVRAADADTYEAIAKKYPSHAHPARVRGSEARRWIALHAADAVVGRLRK